MIDKLKQRSTLVVWTKLDPDKPAGIHEPQLEGDVGWDLEAMEDVTIGPMEAADVPVNVRLWLPPSTWASIRNRSSMGRRHLYVDQNVIDNGYRGPLFVFIRNMRLPRWVELGIPPGATAVENDIQIKAGERVGQIVFHRPSPMWLREVEPEKFSVDTERAEAGFGSTNPS